MMSVRPSVRPSVNFFLVTWISCESLELAGPNSCHKSTTITSWMGLLFSITAFKMAEWQPYLLHFNIVLVTWISHERLTLADPNSRHKCIVVISWMGLLFSITAFKMAEWRPYLLHFNFVTKYNRYRHEKWSK